MAESLIKDKTIDIAKGIVILLVIFEHCLFDMNWYLARIILIFHMPFFFFVSGYCFRKIESKEQLFSYWKKQIIKNLKIVLLIGIFSFPFYLFKDFLKGELTLDVVKWDFINYIYGNSIQGHAFGGGNGSLLHYYGVS